jgi:hypothetical protein
VLSISVNNIFFNVTLEEYTAVKLISADENDRKVLQLNKTFLANSPAYKTVYLQNETKILDVSTIKDNKYYSIIYTALQDNYDKPLKDIQHLISSFKTGNDVIILSDKPLLSASVEIAKNPINIGDTQRLTVTTMNFSSNEKMIDASVTGELLYPSGKSTKLESDVTNATGMASYTWMIDNSFENGMYRVIVVISAADYESQPIIKTFNVTRVS